MWQSGDCVQASMYLALRWKTTSLPVKIHTGQVTFPHSRLVCAHTWVQIGTFIVDPTLVVNNDEEWEKQPLPPSLPASVLVGDGGHVDLEKAHTLANTWICSAESDWYQTHFQTNSHVVVFS